MWLHSLLTRAPSFGFTKWQGKQEGISGVVLRKKEKKNMMLTKS